MAEINNFNNLVILIILIFREPLRAEINNFKNFNIVNNFNFPGASQDY